MTPPGKRLGSPVAYFKSVSGKVYSLGYTSTAVTLGGDVWGWTTVARQGRKALAYPDSPKLRTLAFGHTLVPAAGFDLAGTIEALRRLAYSAELVQVVNVSPHERGYWRITDLQITISQRSVNQGAEIASLSWTLEEGAADVLPKIGHSVNPPGQAIASGAAEDNYTVKAGDSVYTIAAQLLGDAAKWTQLATFNLLGTAAVSPGQVLKVPRASTGIARPE